MFKKLAQYIAAEIKAEFFRLLEEEIAAIGAPGPVIAPGPAAVAAPADPPVEG